MMLEHRENIDYRSTEDKEPDLNDELLELAEVIYKQVRVKVMSELRKENAITIILSDLQDMRVRNPLHADVVTYYTIHNDQSYETIAKHFKCTRQRIYTVVTEESRHYQWLRNLVSIKGREDTVNGNNRREDD